jgi:biotin carboxyl carrier protein
MNVTLYIGGSPVAFSGVSRRKQEVAFTFNGKSYRFRGSSLPDGSFLLEREISEGIWQRMNGTIWQTGKEKRVQLGALETKVSELAADKAHASDQAELSPNAPMPGLVRQILVKRGEQVKKGQALLVMEAMKLQITLSAGGAAVVDDIVVKEGDMVAEGATLVRLSAQEKAA